MNQCERCAQQRPYRDGLCQTCFLIVDQDPKYRPTAGEQLEERLANRKTLARYDSLRDTRRIGGVR